MTPKQFIEQKQPQTDVERVACLAYYLTYTRKQAKFKTVDIEALNTEAAQTKFGSTPNAAVANATSSAKYLAPAGKGMKQISSRGEHLVKALPDRESVKAALKKLKGRSRRGVKKKAPKAKA
jgi:hypothetical protein